MPNHKYTRILEVPSATSQKPSKSSPRANTPNDKRAVQLKNVAYTPSAARTLMETTSRAQVLESLVPLARSPWSSTSSLIVTGHDHARARAAHPQRIKFPSINRPRAKLTNPAAQSANVPLSSWL
ncbi:hypothetical protein BGW38_008576 [Lunasporangiospora selenospora]|uniref:Uncharacterized protein n=1 Tax=Lunasporangiospora selenospora TaxID=979761 RepID=A0A9P6FZW7_9FUNG|nr:hypothetical protein BGW38_008576 [Lunasporangiospora selenospora]